MSRSNSVSFPPGVARDITEVLAALEKRGIRTEPSTLYLVCAEYSTAVFDNSSQTWRLPGSVTLAKVQRPERREADRVLKERGPRTSEPNREELRQLRASILDIAPLSNSPVFELTAPKLGIAASARIVDGEFTVLADSSARQKWAGEPLHAYSNLRAQLEEDGTIVAGTETARFTRNYAFRAPSAAAAVVLGRAANGRTDWVVEGTSTTYAQWESELVPSGGNS
ncbi:DUF4357 domain-containing protein [Nocardia camponoti]|uniref:DUF4357 domain-containing protein n=1 Tax=Nocardia camponoti TaxID=1616106 RepID=A0A917QTD6_9NOCA|nr:DUF4357 domain-containing protein [Nocardia camponoti]GGK66817.1 hypothetical protein GCM10011591_43700 [Nocardia camponoti]